MKAELSGNTITLQNGVKFLATEGETQEEFVARVTETVDRDYCDEVIVEEGLEAYKEILPDESLLDEPEFTPEEIREDQEREAYEEEIAEDALDPYEDIGKTCSFPTQRTMETVTGRIIWVYNDKRKDLLYYRVRDAKGKIHIKRINSKTLTIHEDN